MATTTQIVRESPEVEAAKLGLMESAKQLADQPLAPPQYQYAGLTDLQRQALSQLASGGLGDFMPYLTESAEAYRTSGQAFDPSTVSQYMDPYTEEVVARTQEDILRQREMLDPSLSADAIGAGAFGGSRQGVQAGLADEATLREIGRTSAGLRSAGYQSALAQAATDFENQQRRQALLGQGLGTIAQTLPALTQQQLGFTFDVGTAEQAQKQAELDAQRQNLLQQQYEPYQRLGFLSDIYQGAPSSSMTSVYGASPTQPSPFQQLFGYGVAGLSAAGGAKQLGLF
jgi:hypothetical protein